MMKKGMLLNVWKNIRLYGFNGLFLRNAIRIFVVILLPVILVLFFFVLYCGRILDENMERANLRTLYRVQAMMDMFIAETVSFGDRIYSSKEVDRVVNRLKPPYPSYDDIELRQQVVQLLSLHQSEYVMAAYLYSQQNDYILTPSAAGPPTFFADTRWVQTFFEERTKYNAPFFALTTFAGQKHICYFLPLRTDNPSFSNALAVMFNQTTLDRLFQELYGGEDHTVLILDHEGQIVYATQPGWIGTHVSSVAEGLQYGPDSPEDRQNIMDFHGEKIYANTVPSRSNGWSYVLLTHEDLYASGRTSLYFIITVMVAICFFLSLFCTVIISMEAYEPISIIREMLNNPMNIAPQTVKENEMKHIVGAIYETYGSEMVARSDIKRHMELLNKTRIKALQAQINPHFLYNTLQAISFIFVKETGNRSSQSVELLEQLSELIRDSSRINETLVPLSHEMEYIDKYLTLHKARFGELLRYRFDIPPEALSVPVPKMSLQPLVENALKHGDMGNKENGMIQITGAITENRALQIQISDNGGGMGLDQLVEINRMLSSEIIFTDSHIGLKNVNARLRLLFGGEAGLHLSHREDGVAVTMTVPIREEF